MQSVSSSGRALRITASGCEPHTAAGLLKSNFHGSMPKQSPMLSPSLAIRAVKQRMRSVQNIQKITSAMKMVAASKMRVAQLATEASRGITYPLLKLLGDQPGTAFRMSPSVRGCSGADSMLQATMWLINAQPLMWRKTLWCPSRRTKASAAASTAQSASTCARH